MLPVEPCLRGIKILPYTHSNCWVLEWFTLLHKVVRRNGRDHGMFKWKLSTAILCQQMKAEVSSLIFVRRLKMPRKPEHVEGPTRCPRCGDKVYKAEEVMCEGAKWHKKCFGCKDCRKKLDSTTCNSHEGRPGVSFKLLSCWTYACHHPLSLQLKQIGTLPAPCYKE